MKLQLFNEGLLNTDVRVNVVRNPLNHLYTQMIKGNEVKSIYAFWNPITDILLQLHVVGNTIER